MKINSNIQAMIANNVLQRNEKAYSDSTERLSSGYKINSAKDAPAGIAISNRMNAQIMSMNKANQNAANAVNAIATAEGALSEIQEMVQRLTELSTRAANGTNTTADRSAIQDEVNALKKEIERVANQTEYNTQGLLNGDQSIKGYADKEGIDITACNEEFKQGDFSLKITKGADDNLTFEGTLIEPTDKVDYVDNTLTVTDVKGGQIKIKIDEDKLTGSPATLESNLELHGIGGMKIQVGSSEGQEIRVVIPKISLANMGIESLDMSTLEGAKEAMDKMSNALSYVSKVRSSLGAYQNRLENAISNLDVSIENLTNAFSTIKDVDMAEEMVEYTKLQVLVQAGTSMLTQANEQPQQALQLLQ